MKLREVLLTALGQGGHRVIILNTGHDPVARSRCLGVIMSSAKPWPRPTLPLVSAVSTVLHGGDGANIGGCFYCQI